MNKLKRILVVSSSGKSARVTILGSLLMEGPEVALIERNSVVRIRSMI